MKTIRNGVFETNSSSTHSISIQRIGERKTKKTPRPLLIDNILHPEHLIDYRETVQVYDDGYITVCRTKEEKAALIIHWMINNMKWEDFPKEDFDKTIEVLKGVLAYDDIIIDFCPDYYPSSEDEIVEISFNHITNELLEVILDPTIEIIDSDMPY